MIMAASTSSSSPSHTSLLTSINARGHIHLILGTNPLAAARTAQSLAAGARPILIAPPPPTSELLHYGVQKHIDAGTLTWHARDFAFEADLLSLGRPEVGGVVDAVFVTAGRHGSTSFAARVSLLCKRHRIPVNVVDAPALCSFSLLSTHVDGPLQIGVTTNGRGCKLAGRIRREVAAGLPPGLGAACARLGEARRRLLDEEVRGAAGAGGEVEKGEEKAVEDGVDDSLEQAASFNRLVAEADTARTQRARWLAQVCEYWPLKKLAAISDADVAAVLQSASGAPSVDHGPVIGGAGGARRQSGRVILAGAGPGHPELLTRAAHKALLAADLVLADKLVPAAVLELIPRRTPVVIARKFPGNADQAQEELLTQALAGYRAGQTVVRLKQGDPFLYGRGGEEVAFLRAAGCARVTVIPGVTSALSAPLFAGVPPTQRDVADQVLVCTGTGKKGRPPPPPGFARGRTAVFLMALHRIVALVRELTTRDGEGEEEKNGNRALWPVDTPCAVVERASCPDQRVIRTTLRFVAEAIETEGSRPPGLLVVGAACEALYTPEKGRSWVVEEGFEGLDLDELAEIDGALVV